MESLGENVEDDVQETRKVLRATGEEDGNSIIGHVWRICHARMEFRS